MTNTQNNIKKNYFTTGQMRNALIQIENAVFDFAEETDFTTIGDINSDNIINILDVILIINIILGSDNFNNLADINIDGNIDVLDVVLLVNIILN